MTGPHRRTRPAPALRPPLWPRLAAVPRRCADFCATYALYRRGGNTRRYSARIAYGCAFLDLPF